REDLFTVVHEQVMTPTAKYADLLLPATTFLENKDLYTGYGHFYMGCVDRVIEPLGEARSNFDLFQEVAAELGFRDEPFLQSPEKRLASYVATMTSLPDGFVFDPNAETGWIESTRKRTEKSVKEMFGVDFSFCADVEPGVPVFACVTEAAEFADPDLLARFPFKLITPPHKDLLNSTFGERYPGVTGEVFIHPDDATDFDIPDGAVVYLENLRGSTKRTARITDIVQKGLLVAEGIFWQTG
ncbi:MAG: molybdopterin-dependent oxidoreductase, partial [Gammaproteobacteria bacterium]|nr:molybdopterin-dependent oxidoreductase [Gammaproteobacteria bacterium]